MGCTESSEGSRSERFNIEPLPNDCSLEIWLAWKENLQHKIGSKIETEVPNILGCKLQESIGFYGQQIINNFIIDIYEKHNFYILLRKLDLFFYLRSFKRNEEEPIKDYIRRIMNEATQWGSNKPAAAVKEILSFDLKSINFLRLIIQEVSMRNDINDLKVLSIEEITFLINVYDNREFIKRKKNYIQRKENNDGCLHNQDCCGHPHNGIQVCDARGKRCYLCNDLNHFARVCPKPYKIDCSRCGVSHLKYKCEAFGHKCSRCNKNNHFYWRCHQQILPQSGKYRRVVIIKQRR